ncbi:tyrosine phosphatase-like protein [Fusarium solani]|uniref:Very-long-chain (3R)-3-hydroxyacyl-CoA dehydratase n=1 Tax=Fusarium solani TaxID=169388 RepID=A0A9P9KTN3_FUSSL|nr:tyrosine phosphatase-like protein [Fusarium solani]KAH7268188.1 tyrosine phosphatase-like protein [Fusarium solani]
MARSTSQTQPRRVSNVYLCIYNLLSALLRICILLSTAYLWTTSGNVAVWDKLSATARWSETLTALEVVHALTGLVRAPPATTILQVAGRNTIVWAITRNYPDVAAEEAAYSYMLMAWNLADSVRYLYFAFQTGTSSVPSILLWARYNLFIVLYPIGILSEARLVYRVIEPSKARNSTYQYLLWFGLAIYAPAFYILYGHMLAQRAKISRSNRAKTL